MSTSIKLEVSENIISETDVSDTYIPANGKKIYGFEFKGAALYTANSYVAAVWDYGGPNETILWSTNGTDSLKLEKDFLGDGVKKIAIVCSNGENSSATISGSLNFKVED